MVSFACSVGLVIFSRHHHVEEQKEGSHFHRPAHAALTKHIHADDAGHHHSHGGADKAKHPGEGNADCCSQNVVKLNEQEFVTNQQVLPFPAGPTGTINSFYFQKPRALVGNIKSAPPFLRSRAPAIIQNLRVIIQSFQV